MQPTLFASYIDAETAERIVGALLDEGVAPEDISAVISRRDDSRIFTTSPSLEESGAGLAMVDAGEGGRESFGHEAIQTEGSYIYESKIGGGISTSTPDDDVSGIEEMDDAQEVAEEMIYPATGHSYSSNEQSDVDQGANTGFFNTTKPGREGLGKFSDAESFAVVNDGELSSLLVPGLGIVLGDGDLATAVVGAGMATEAGGNPAADLKEYLTDVAAPQDLAWLLTNDFNAGGAVLAVAIPPGKITAEGVQTMLEQSGARNVQFVDA